MDYDKTRVPDTYDAGRTLNQPDRDALLAVFAAHIPAHEVATVVDLGCGTGRYSRFLSEALDAEVIGIDPSAKMLDQAIAKHDDARLSFRAGSAEKLPLDDGSADLVFMSMVHHHLKIPPETARECRRILRPRWPHLHPQHGHR